MIRNFKSKGLEGLFTKGDSSKVNQPHLKRIRILLSILNQAKELRDLNVPGGGLHPLKGELQGFYSLMITGNWRLIFRFEEGEVFDVDYLDYH